LPLLLWQLRSLLRKLFGTVMRSQLRLRLRSLD
jgi:hypothetical protein